MSRYSLDPQRAAAVLAATGWTRRALSRKLDLHVEVVSRWIRARHTIPAYRLEQIAEIIGVPVDAFFGSGGAR